LCSQVAHATFMALEKQKDKKIINKWKSKGMCVIVLQCRDVVSLLSIKEYLKESSIAYGLCVDEGITEVEPMTPTALATEVLTEEDFWMFKTMGLLK